MLGFKTKEYLNPDDIPDLNGQLVTNTNTILLATTTLVNNVCTYTQFSMSSRSTTTDIFK